MAERDHVRITTAPRTRAEEVASRQRAYVISMSIRTACFIGAVAVGDWWLRWVLLAGAVFLPYVAVVIANNTDQREEQFALPHHLHHRELEGSTSDAPN